MNTNIAQDAILFLEELVSQPLCYGFKSPDTELYDFGFGTVVEVDSWRGGKKTMCAQTIHALCRFRIIQKIGVTRSEWYYEDTPQHKFNQDIAPLIGLCVKRIALSEKNDLWLDLGDYWIVFVTYETEDESWRFFISNIEQPHLVASNSWIRFDC